MQIYSKQLKFQNYVHSKIKIHTNQMENGFYSYSIFKTCLASII